MHHHAFVLFWQDIAVCQIVTGSKSNLFRHSSSPKCVSFLTMLYYCISFLGSNSDLTEEEKLLPFHLLPVMGHLGFPQQSNVSIDICYKTADTPKNLVFWLNPMLFLWFLLLLVDLLRSLHGRNVPKLSGCVPWKNAEGCVSSKIKSIMISTHTLAVLDSQQKQF